MFHQIQQFTINEEINLVSVSGEIVYNDNNIKGIICAYTNSQFCERCFLNKTSTIYSRNNRLHNLVSNRY